LRVLKIGLTISKESTMANLDQTRSKTTPYDAAEYLKTSERMAAYLEAAFEEGDPRYIVKALGNLARVRGMSQLAKDTGLTREVLNSSLSERGNPTLSTLLKVTKALGIQLKAAART